MIDDKFYLSIPGNLERAVDITGLAPDEIEELVGRFAAHSFRAGKLRGKIVVRLDGRIEIRKCFGEKVLWREE